MPSLLATWKTARHARLQVRRHAEVSLVLHHAPVLELVAAASSRDQCPEHADKAQTLRRKNYTCETRGGVRISRQAAAAKKLTAVFADCKDGHESTRELREELQAEYDELVAERHRREVAEAAANAANKAPLGDATSSSENQDSDVRVDDEAPAVISPNNNTFDMDEDSCRPLVPTVIPPPRTVLI